MIKSSTKNLMEILKTNPLFSAVKDEDLLEIVSKHCVEKSFRKGNIIFSKSDKEKCIGFIVKGTVQVKKEHIVLNKLKESDIFGAVTLYGKSEGFVNDIVALTDCKVAFISKNGIELVLSKSPGFAKRYIAYLSQKIYFLNKKIETYTSPTANEKLYAYLSSIAVDGVAEINIKMTELANQLNLSRASLYRAFTELEADGKAEKEGKRIKLLN